MLEGMYFIRLTTQTTSDVVQDCLNKSKHTAIVSVIVSESFMCHRKSLLGIKYVLLLLLTTTVLIMDHFFVVVMELESS